MHIITLKKGATNMISHFPPTDPAAAAARQSDEMLKRMNHTITQGKKKSNNTSVFDTLSFHTLLLRDLKAAPNLHSLLSDKCMKNVAHFQVQQCRAVKLDSPARGA